jgi:hypothetical protein
LFVGVADRRSQGRLGEQPTVVAARAVRYCVEERCGFWRTGRELAELPDQVVTPFVEDVEIVPKGLLSRQRLLDRLARLHRRSLRRHLCRLSALAHCYQ